MLTKTLFGQVPNDIIVAFGACDQDLLAEILRTSKGRVIWLSPNENASIADDERVREATNANRLLFLVGDPKSTLPSLSSQLADQPITLVFADLDGEVARTPEFAQDVADLIRSITGRLPRTVLAVRQGDRATGRPGA